MYAKIEPYNYQRLFTCFDQHDIKSALKIKVLASKEWCVLANEYEKSITDFK